MLFVSTGIIIQARMGSTRLPGKVLMNLDDKYTVLGFLLEQLKHCKNSEKIILATTILKEDDAIDNLFGKQSVQCFRGNPTDVLDRYYQCAKQHSLSTIIRITGDCPLIDPNIIDKMISTQNHVNFSFRCQIKLFCNEMHKLKSQNPHQILDKIDNLFLEPTM